MTAHSLTQSAPDEHVPLFVDLDGSLLRSDMLVETFFAGVRADPLNLLRSLGWLRQGRARLKQRLAAVGAVDASSLPVDPGVCEYLRREAGRGRRVYLATASDRSVAEGIAEHLGFFSGVLASDGVDNLKGARKLAAIQGVVGDGPFDYLGNGPEDLPIWRAARRALVAGDAGGVVRRLRAEGRLEAHFPHQTNSLRAVFRALRPHQWLKNLLVLVPLLTSFSFTDVTKILHVIAAFAAFSMVASATYIVNDLLDLASDRRHLRKRKRPFAAGDVSITLGLALSACLLLLGVLLAAASSLGLLAMLCVYLVTTAGYSLYLKNLVLADVMVLGGLYTLRLVAGAVAIPVDVSVWLLAFSAFLFFSLALVKRCAELKLLEATDSPVAHGRDYRVSDLSVLWPTGIAAGVGAVVIFALYISSAEVMARFQTPTLLWFICPCLGYWIGRMWIKTGRGEMHDDPLVYTATDRTSRLALSLIVGLFVAAWLL